jgi:hypothetical protein
MVYVGKDSVVGPMVVALSRYKWYSDPTVSVGLPPVDLAVYLGDKVEDVVEDLPHDVRNRVQSRIGPRLLMLEAQVSELREMTNQSNDWQYMDDEIDLVISEALKIFVEIISLDTS